MADIEKKFVSVGQLKEGSFVLIDDVPCKIMSFEKSKPGKHGAAKARVVGIGIFDGSKKTLLKPTSADAEVPIINRRMAQVVAVMGDSIQLMDTESYQTLSTKKPDDIQGLTSGNEVEYITFGDQIKIMRKK